MNIIYLIFSILKIKLAFSRLIVIINSCYVLKTLTGDLCMTDIDAPQLAGDFYLLDVCSPQLAGDFYLLDVCSPQPAGDFYPLDVCSPQPAGDFYPLDVCSRNLRVTFIRLMFGPATCGRLLSVRCLFAATCGRLMYDIH
jgi:hypothetical protein